MHSAVSLKVRTGAMVAASANQVLSLFGVHLAGNYYRFVPIEAREYGLARDWIGRFTTPLRTLDALHVGAARTQRLGSRPEAMAFISCDLRLLKAAASIGFLTPIPPGKG